MHTGEWKSAASWAQSPPLYILWLCFCLQWLSLKARLSHTVAHTHYLTDKLGLVVLLWCYYGSSSFATDQQRTHCEPGRETHRDKWDIFLLMPCEGGGACCSLPYQWHMSQESWLTCVCCAGGCRRQKAAILFVLRGKGEGSCKWFHKCEWERHCESCIHVTQMDTPQTHTHTSEHRQVTAG